MFHQEDKSLLKLKPKTNKYERLNQTTEREKD